MEEKNREVVFPPNPFNHDFWVCECKDHYIRPNIQERCEICGKSSITQPYAKISEVNSFCACPGCSAKPGENHLDGCEYETCHYCGQQYKFCPHISRGDRKIKWAGFTEIDRVALKYGWFMKDDPTVPNTKKAAGEVVWDPKKRRFVIIDRYKIYILIDQLKRVQKLTVSGEDKLIKAHDLLLEYIDNEEVTDILFDLSRYFD